MTPAPTELQVDHATLDQHPVLNVNADISVRPPRPSDRCSAEVGDLVAVRPDKEQHGVAGTDIWVGIVINLAPNKLTVHWLENHPTNPRRFLYPERPLRDKIRYGSVLSVVTLNAQHCLPKAKWRSLIALL